MTWYVRPPRRRRRAWSRPSLRDVILYRVLVALVYLASAAIVAVGLWFAVAATIVLLTPHP